MARYVACGLHRKCGISQQNGSNHIIEWQSMKHVEKAHHQHQWHVNGRSRMHVAA
jgi:hypothetical protein